MTLSIKQVRYFIAAADAGQVSQAAIELNVSQSAVTAAIKQLEEDLSVRLFDRAWRSPPRAPASCSMHASSWRR
jgi:DNA-binding transcriptional LysR family regulator